MSQCVSNPKQALIAAQAAGQKAIRKKPATNPCVPSSQIQRGKIANGYATQNGKEISSLSSLLIASPFRWSGGSCRLINPHDAMLRSRVVKLYPLVCLGHRVKRAEYGIGSDPGDPLFHHSSRCTCGLSIGSPSFPREPIFLCEAFGNQIASTILRAVGAPKAGAA